MLNRKAYSSAIKNHTKYFWIKIEHLVAGGPLPSALSIATLISSFSSSTLAQDSAAEEKAGAEDEAEVIPEAAVMNLIETDTLAEDGNDECYR